MTRHTVIFVPGLGSRSVPIASLVYFWRLYGFTPIVFNMAWRDGGEFQPKLEQLLTLIDTELTRGEVSLVGMSAGGSAVMNAFVARKKKVSHVVSVCGRLDTGPQKG